MRRNQHRWKQSLDDHIRALLEGAVEGLVWAWNSDMRHPKSFPHNTSATLNRIKREIKDYQLGEPKAHNVLRLPRPRRPKCLADLVDEQVIRAVYEYQNDGTYEQALRVADSGSNAGIRIFQKILNAIEAAYRISHFGEETAPKPRIHFLHRGLLELARVIGRGDLTHEGVAEFLDDLCPCGKRHELDAIRKLRKRQKRASHKDEE